MPEAPKEAMVFMEDLPEDQQDVSGMGKYGAGEDISTLSRLDFKTTATDDGPLSRYCEDLTLS